MKEKDNVAVQSQNIEAERAVLCSIFLKAPETKEHFKAYKQKLERDVFSLLDESDFYDERNAQIYSAIRRVIDRGTIPDFITVSEILDKKLVGYLLSITDFLPAPVNLREYVKIVKKHSLQRQADLLATKRKLLRQELETNDDERIREEIEAILQKEIEINKQLADLLESLVIKRYTGEGIRKPVLRCNGLLPEGHVSLLAGSAATGKTYIALTLTALYILETKRPALIWLSEDLSETEYRLSQMFENVELWRKHKDLIIQNIRYVEDIPEPLLTKEYGALDVNMKALGKLKRYISDFNFILLDPLTDFYGQEENNNTAARRFMNVLKRLVFQTDRIILLTHHTNKADVAIPEDLEKIDVYELRRKIRGASAFIDAPRTTLYLLHNVTVQSSSGLSAKYLVNIKSNVARTGIVSVNGEPVKWEIPFPYNESGVKKMFADADSEEDEYGGVL